MKTKPYKILYVENGIGYGGAAICLRHLVRNLDRNQYTPMVVTGKTGPQYQEIAQEANWQYIPDRRFDTVGLKRTLAKKSWPDRLPGLRWLLIQCLARLDDIGNFLPFFVQFLIVASKFKPNLIHVNNEPLCNRAAIVTGKLLSIPVVCHIRGEQKGSWLMQWLFKLPDHFIPVSHWISESIGSVAGVHPDKRTVVYDGIALEDLDLNADGMAFRNQFNIPKDAFAVGLVGLLIPWKGQRLFLDCANELKEKIPNLKMLIVGGTPEECQPYEQELRRIVADGNLESVVSFTGHVSDMPAVYNGLDAVLSASTSPEPLGTVVIECMAMGRPLIGPNHGGAAEMMDHDETGLLFTPGNKQHLIDSIYRLYNEKQLGKKLGKSAREKALEIFSVIEHVRKIQDIYQQLLDTKSHNHS